MKPDFQPILDTLKGNLDHYVHNTFGNTLAGVMGVAIAQTTTDNLIHIGGIVVLVLSILNLSLQCYTGFENLTKSRKKKGDKGNVDKGS